MVLRAYTQEAEAGELLEPGKPRLQRAEIAPLYSSLGNKRDSVSKKIEVYLSSVTVTYVYILLAQ